MNIYYRIKVFFLRRKLKKNWDILKQISVDDFLDGIERGKVRQAKWLSSDVSWTTEYMGEKDEM